MKQKVMALGQRAAGFITSREFFMLYLAFSACLFVMFNPSFAYAAGVEGVVKGVAATGGGIVAVIMIVMIIRHAVAYAQGQGSVGKIVVEALILLLMIGLIAVAMNYSKFQNTFEGVAGGAVNVVTEEADGALK